MIVGSALWRDLREYVASKPCTEVYGLYTKMLMCEMENKKIDEEPAAAPIAVPEAIGDGGAVAAVDVDVAPVEEVHPPVMSSKKKGAR